MTTVLTQLIARALLLPTFLIALAIMLKGYADTGDGFSAGVIASLGVLMQCVAFGPDELDTLPLVKYAPAGTFVGLILALMIVFVPALFGPDLLTHWPAAGDSATHFGTLEFITPVVFDIGVFLVVFGFCVGVIGAIARAQQRVLRDRARYDRLLAERTAKREAAQ
ncbi:MAG: MnhB domain-containing protein [Thermomicrobiales bacterium]